VYDTLRDCLTEVMSEYGVIEHRFSHADPSAYRFLVKRYGHTALGPSRYTASSFLALLTLVWVSGGFGSRLMFVG